MAKMITRTITVHTYTTGTVDLATASVTNVRSHNFPYKLNERQKRVLAKEDGNPILNEATSDCLYAMTIDEFMAHAKQVLPGEGGEDDG